MFLLRLRTLAACALSLIGSVPALALEPRKAITQYVHEVWRTEQGLPLNSINAIAQTPDGYLWLGTELGPVRFDGVRFTTFDERSSPGLVTGEIQVLRVDRAGALWLGAQRGLSRMRDGVFTAFTPREGLPDELVRCLADASPGGLWIGTSGSGAARLEEGRFHPVPDLPSPIVNDVLTDSGGTVWFATRAGLSRLANGRIETMTTREGLASNAVLTLHEDREGSLWIGTFGGLNRLRDGRMETFTTRDGLSNNVVNSLVSDTRGSLWIGTYGGGLNRFYDGRFERFTSREGLSDDLVTSLLLDREGSLWICTDQGGLNRLKDGPMTAWTVREGLPHDVVRTVLEGPDGAIWIGTHGGGLARLQNGEFTNLTTRQGLASNSVFSLCLARDGGLWIGSYNGGLNRLAGGRLTGFRHAQLPPNEFVTAMVEDEAGALWLGTYGGGLKRVFQGSVTSFRTDQGLSNDWIWSLLPDRTGGLWIGTRRGLNRFENGRLKGYPGPEGPADAAVWTLHEEDDGALWLATDRGLYRFKQERFTAYTREHGLFDDSLLQVIGDGRGHLWLGSNRGLYRVRLEELNDLADGRRKTVTSHVYGIGDGMKSAECNGSTQPSAWRGRDGRLWVATSKGVVTFAPGEIRSDPPPPVRIEEFRVDTRPVAGSAKAPARIGPGSHQYEFSYTAMSLRSPERTRFRYRLEDIDDGWVEAGSRRVAYYTNLPPGTHGFHVIASNGDGVWGETGASFAFRVQPRFTQTIGFYAAIAAALALAAWAAHRYRVRRLLQVERVRMRIASDLHDDIGSSLSQIAILSEVARSQLGERDPALAAPLARIGALSRESVASMGDIVWAIDPQKDRPTHLTQRLRRLANEVLGSHGIAFDFETSGEERDVALPADVRRQVFLIFKETLNNAVRHSACTELQIQLVIERARVVMSITDNGKGFEPAETGEGHGLRSLHQRAQTLGGRLDVASGKGGTKVVLNVPLRGGGRFGLPT